MKKHSRKILLAGFVSCVSVPSLAQDAGSEGEDPLLNAEIPEGAITKDPPLEMGTANNESGFYVAGGLYFGQARTTESGASAGTSMLFAVEPGYRMKYGSWNRTEASLQLFSGTTKFRVSREAGGQTTIPIGFGALARLGWGRSLGEKVYGTTRVGIGPIQAKYESNPEAGSLKSKGALSGFASQIAYEVVMPFSGSVELLGGASWTHLQIDVDNLQLDGNDISGEGKNVIVNLQQINIGIQLRL